MRSLDGGRSRRDVLHAAAIGAVGVAGVPGLTAGHASTTSACGTIDEPGTYRLDGDIDGSEECLAVAAEDVVLAGDGHRIAGDGAGVGIHVHADGVTIRDVTVDGFDRGIVVSNADELSLAEVDVHDNGTGIDAELGSALSITGSRVAENEGPGILVALWDGLIVEETEIRANGGTGIATDEGWGLSVIESSIVDNDRGAMASPGDEFRGNTIADNVTHGIDVDPFPQPPFQDEVAILENEIRGNGETGILVRLGTADVSGNVISGNRIGVSVSARSENGPEWLPDATVTENRIAGNDEAGLTNDVDREIDATCNWWGAASGPMHPDSPADDPGGDVVEGDASFVPWRTEPDGACDGAVVGLDVEITDVTENVAVGTPLTVSYTVTNRDDAGHTGTVSFGVDGERIDSTDVELDSGEATDGTFTYEPGQEDTGELRLAVGTEDANAVTHVAVVASDDGPNSSEGGSNSSDKPANTTGTSNASDSDSDVIPGFGVLGTLLALAGVGAAMHDPDRD